jgi:hypothetical protein
MNSLFIMAFIALTIVMVLLPMVIASTRGHKEALAINILTLWSIFGGFFLSLLSLTSFGLVSPIYIGGFSLIGWSIALTWACTSNVLPRLNQTAARTAVAAALAPAPTSAQATWRHV